MTTEESNDKQLQETGRSKVPTRIDLSSGASMDLSWLDENERKELVKGHVKGFLDIDKKAQELNVDAVSLRQTLDVLEEKTAKATESGTSATISHTQSSSVGRTEILMGNTERAQRGKLSKSQTGERDWMPIYVVLGVVAVIIIVALMNS